jgi:hypothetical protein
LPIQKAVLKAKVAAKDVISSSPSLPARLVSSVVENVQDGSKVWAAVKATIIKPGTVVVQSVAEQAVTDYANSQVPGLGDAIGLVAGMHRGNGAAHSAGLSGRASAGASCALNKGLDHNSFTSDTPVLMADGSAKRIDQVQVGDEVRATDPTTGETGNRTVTDTRSHESERLLYRITVTTDDGSSTITATDEHPFWIESLQRWVEAKDLKLTYTFETSDHRSATITTVVPLAEHRQVHNLTVDDLHTYFVSGAGSSVTILVHNANPGAGGSCKRNYTAAYEFQLDDADKVATRPVHFNRANAALDADLQADPDFADYMESISPGIRDRVSEVGGRQNPVGFVWEHASTSTVGLQEQGMLRLVPKEQHTPGSPWWRVLHPNKGASGGFAEWGNPKYHK